MVGKSIESKSSRIFQQCYVKCCSLQNLTPISYVIPSGNGKVLDFCVDRIKYSDWGPILNALSCDLSLESISIRCRQQVKTVLEQVDTERLAKNVTKRAVILTRFMLSNLIDACSQVLANSALLNSILLEGLPLKMPYLNPFVEVIYSNNFLQHLHLPRCLIGDAGCLSVCKALRGLPNVATLNLSTCELTEQGAIYIADLIKYQKIHRYSENWKHTLRYRIPELDTMAGLRRLTLCGNSKLGDTGFAHLIEVLRDDLWIKAIDMVGCGLTEISAEAVCEMLCTNSSLVVVDLRDNPQMCSSSLAQIRMAIRKNETDLGTSQYRWLSSSSTSIDARTAKLKRSATTLTKDKFSQPMRYKYINNVNAPPIAKKEKSYTEVLEEKLREETSHRQQLEQLNSRLLQQLRQLEQRRADMWAQAASSGSDKSCSASEQSSDASSRSNSSGSVLIDQNTLTYIQHAFKDIYTFIKNNKCSGNCVNNSTNVTPHQIPPPAPPPAPPCNDPRQAEQNGAREANINILLKKAKSAHVTILENLKNGNKMSKSASQIGENKQNGRGQSRQQIDPNMFERQMGDSQMVFRSGADLLEEMLAQKKELLNNSQRSNLHDNFGSSETLVCSASESEQSVKSAVERRNNFYDSSDDSI